MEKKHKILVTGSAGFIGFHLVNKLLERGDEVVGLDIINDYYDVNLKYDRLSYAGISKESIEYNQLTQSESHSNYRFIQLELEEKEKLQTLFEKEQFDSVCNLAAQAGVRYSIENPHAYLNSNILGFLNVLECCRHTNVKHLAFASSSSVYGLNEKLPFSTSDNVDHPISLYAASKKSNELMAHTYSHLFGLATTGLRFFTVYGPWGRPDMALFLFAEAILKEEPIKVFNYGEMVRDFTYVEDIVKGVIKVIDNPPQGDQKWQGTLPNPATSKAPYHLYNIGNNNPYKLMDFINLIEEALGKKAKMDLMPIQPGDVKATYADVSNLVKNLGYKPNTPLKEGIFNFVDWYKTYYKIA